MFLICRLSLKVREKTCGIARRFDPKSKNVYDTYNLGVGVWQCQTLKISVAFLFQIGIIFNMKTLEEIITILSQYKPIVQEKYKVSELGIFGSYVRGEQSENSDVDILIEFQPNFRFGLLTFCNLENYLSDLLGVKVDLVMKEGLKPRIGKRILAEVIYL